ncbi:MAG: carbohydrate ABC transporter permease [Acidobacteriota bacterium]
MRLKAMGFGAALALALAFLLAPPVWQMLTSLKSQEQLGVLPPLLPDPPTAAHYHSVFEGRPFGRYILNSAVVASLTMLLALALGAPAAYALARLPLPGAGWVLFGFLGVAMFPPVSIVSPLYLAIRALGLRDSWWGLVVADTTFVLPLTIWILSTFFLDVPRDLLRAARVVGATTVQAFFHVARPVAAPGLAASAILAFVFAWNEFLFALVFTSSPAAQTVPVGIALFPGLHEMPWGEIAAASLIASAPVLVLILVFQRRIVQGLTAGAVRQ